MFLKVLKELHGGLRGGAWRRCLGQYSGLHYSRLDNETIKRDRPKMVTKTQSRTPLLPFIKRNSR